MFVPATRVKISKTKNTYEFIVPVDFAREIGLNVGQNMAIYVDDESCYWQ